MSKPIHEIKDVSGIKMLITFVLLVVAILGYVFVNNYLGANLEETEKTIVKDAGDETLSDINALKIAEQKYYVAIATITNTKTDIDRVYNPLKTTSVVLTDDSLISSLNKFGAKTYTANSSADIVTNYDKSIASNFTDDIINNKILMNNGFIGKVGDDYYIVKEKVDNYFFKKAEFKLISKTNDTLYYKVVQINYSSSCADSGEVVPSITCTDTEKSDAKDFKLIKKDDTWLVSEITI